MRSFLKDLRLAVTSLATSASTLTFSGGPPEPLTSAEAAPEAVAVETAASDAAVEADAESEPVVSEASSLDGDDPVEGSLPSHYHLIT